ncbi:MAG: GFA family protein [Woeseiaceae bacterium]|nr:GFA family protein [Woeseiaceae bacterium]
MNEPTRHGHCFCGRIRFVITAAETFSCLCYCASCQRAAGAPCVGWATYGRDAFVITGGALRLHLSSPGVTRGHCPDCGTTITYENAQRPGDIDVTLNSLDEPGRPAPRAHIWTEDKPAWFTIADALPVYRRTVSD